MRLIPASCNQLSSLPNAALEWNISWIWAIIFENNVHWNTATMLMKIICHKSCSVMDNYHRSIGQLLQTITVLIIYSIHDLFSNWSKAYEWLLENQRLHIIQQSWIMSRTLKVTGNHVMYDCVARFLRLIMSSSHALCCLLICIF